MKTNEELIDMYINPDFYQPDFIDGVIKEIGDRKLPIDALDKIKKEKEKADVSTLSIGKQGNSIYITICFVLALAGGIFGIIAGYIYGFSKQKGPDGNLYHVYNETTRKLGYAMIVIGAFIIFLSIKSIAI